MKQIASWLVSPLVVILLASSLTGCNNDNANLYQHDDSSIRIDSQKRLVITVPGQPQATIDAHHRLFIGQRRIELGPDQQPDAARYYVRVSDIRESGWETGRAGADFAVQAVETVAKRVTSGNMDGIKDALETDKQHLLASVGSLCETLKHALSAQNRLASDVPDFRPYTVIKPVDIADCRRHVAEKRASN